MSKTKTMTTKNKVTGKVHCLLSCTNNILRWSTHRDITIIIPAKFSTSFMSVTTKAIHSVHCSAGDLHNSLFEYKGYGYIHSRYAGFCNVLENVHRMQPSERLRMMQPGDSSTSMVRAEQKIVRLLQELVSRLSLPGDIVVAARRLQERTSDGHHYSQDFKVDTSCRPTGTVCASRLDYAASVYIVERYKVVEKFFEQAISQLSTFSTREILCHGHGKPTGGLKNTFPSLYWKVQYKAPRSRRRSFRERDVCARKSDLHLLWYAVLSKSESASWQRRKWEWSENIRGGLTGRESGSIQQILYASSNF